MRKLLTHSSAGDVLATLAVTLLVASPMVFTSSGFAPDFTNHLWLTWAAGNGFLRNGYPSYYLNTTGLGVFYPLFAFYGGTLYALTGAAGQILDNPILAYVAVTMLAIAGAYGGALWLGRQLGLRGWIAHAPALTLVTSAYFITNLYGRGAWPELMAVAAISPLLASGVYLVRAPRWRPLAIFVFVASTVLFSGSHNLTLLWGTTVAAAALAILWIALGAPRRLPLRRLAMVGVLGLTSVLVNAWFLIPDLTYERNVAISNEASVSWEGTSFFNTPAVLLDPLRLVPRQSTTPGLFVQAPDWFLAWGLAAGALLLWRSRGQMRLRRWWLGAALVVALLLAMIMLEPFWAIVPFPFDQIQFPYRLNSYVFYAVAGLVLVGAVALQRAAACGCTKATITRLRIALALACVVSLALCVWQEWAGPTRTSKSYAHRGEALASVNRLPASWYDGGSYRDVHATPVQVPGERILFIKPSLVHGDRFAAWMEVPPGPEPILTNINGGGYLVHIGGLERIGRAESGLAVVRRTNGGGGPVYVVVETAHSAAVEVGRAASLVAIAAILALIAGVGVRTRRRSSRPRASQP
ncbi:MAG TPA: hypothetical protein VN892_02665 [Solirubrobacteraceae bacterium]|nr:hypothetical protein [Solirubrobacteraceae bacterium]